MGRDDGYSHAILVVPSPRVLAGSCEDRVLEFDKESRAAPSADNVPALALLVDYPLRVNSSDGGFTLTSPKALQTKYKEIFSDRVREAVFTTPASELGCSYRGVMYGLGTIWVTADSQEARISAINLPDKRDVPEANRQKVLEFACDTELHRLLVVQETSGEFTLLVWSKPRSVLESPDLTVLAGEMRGEGTGWCSHRVWSFAGRATSVTLWPNPAAGRKIL